MMEATAKPKEAVEFAYDYLAKNCIWAVNTGYSRQRTEWSVQNSIENGDMEPGKKPAYEQIVAASVGQEALAAVGGPVTIGTCKE